MDFYPRPPRGGRRLLSAAGAFSFSDFYPRPPRGGRPSGLSICASRPEFLSTPSARRATNGHLDLVRLPDISIHALREEGDAQEPVSAEQDVQFLSTPSARRATFCRAVQLQGCPISIHALREEGDITVQQESVTKEISNHAHRQKNDGIVLILWPTFFCDIGYFFPRPPRGGRRYCANPVSCAGSFLSTPSARRATGMPLGVEPSQQISIHALREEGDFLGCIIKWRYAHFYPRPPRGGRPAGPAPIRRRANFYPRPPRGGRRTHTERSALHWEFLSTPSARRAT